MGLFQHKKPNSKMSAEERAVQAEKHFFDEYFREELREHGRQYFEKIVKQNGELFKIDLDTTVTQLNKDLKEQATKQLETAINALNLDIKSYVTKQLDARLVESGAVIKEAQDKALAALDTSAQSLQQHFTQLSESVQKNVAEQEALMKGSFEENTARINAIRQSQDTTLQTLIATTEALQHSFQQLSATVQKNVEAQEVLLVKGFEENMSRIIEHYLLTAVGEQFDLKSQLPSIIQRMENNKQAILDDIAL